MNILSAESISKSYSEKILFDKISLGINEGEKIGLIGINGTGKSTLLKVIAGVETVDEGNIIKGNSVNIEFLSQNPYFHEEATVLEQVFKEDTPVMNLIREYEEVIQNPDIQSEKIIELTHKMDVMDAWNIESEAKTILTKLGVENFNAKVGKLSGGQKKRIALATVLINPSDLLILDEPTNHLDNETIEWLEQYLNKRKGALLMVTHDRYFLDRVANQIIEIDKGKLYTYKGNYSVFLEKKIEREEVDESNENKRKSLLKKELAWIKKGAKARSTKQKARIDRFEKLKEKTADLTNEKLEISVVGSRLGKKIIEIEHINKSFNNNKIIDDFNYIVIRDDRIGIIGTNGTGKSTLINILSGRFKADSGNVNIGETVKIGVYSQENYHMNENLRVIEYIREGAEILTTAEGEKISASQMLEKFLFEPELQWTPISKLSGGEKRRLYLLRVLMEGPNVLFLDEPTNDLDIETLSILEEYIDQFQGPVISVSHDRYFLDRVAKKIFSFEGDGKIEKYVGNYSDFIENKKKHNAEIKVMNSAGDKTKKTVNKDNKNVDKNGSKKKLKFSFKETREYEQIDTVIAELEEQIDELESKISETTTNYVLLQELLKDKENAEKALEEKMQRWVYLNELAEKIAKQKESKIF